ncbi:PAS domain S-box protein [Gorillibacterium sp. sgz500922]|uniref:PAS domain S-box protein n=1 Tax=Gorillibacterium sp. sgz500922 TaxID=3446694 RepID=UPI003F66FC9C
MIDQLFQHGLLAMAVLSVKSGGWSRLSPAFCRLLDYTEGDLLSRRWNDLLAEEDRGRGELETLVRELRSQEQPSRRLELKLLRAGGEPVRLSLVLTLHRAPEPEEEELLVQAQEVPAERRLLRERRRREAFLGLFMDSGSSPYLISVSSVDGVLEFVSPSVKKMLGHAPDEMIGRNREDFYHPDDRLPGGKPPGEESGITMLRRVRHKDGRYSWLETTTHLLRDKSGKIERVLAIGRDISDRIAMEEQLRESERNYRLLSEQAQDLISRHSLEPGAAFLYASPASLPLLGYRPEELIGVSSLSLVHPDDLPRVQGSLKDQLIGHKGSASIMYRYRRKDGEYLWLETSSRVVYGEDGKPLEINAIARDVSATKRYMEEIEQLSYDYTLILNTVSEGIFGVDLEGKITFLNPAGAAMLGIRADGVISQPDLSFIHQGGGTPYGEPNSPLYRAIVGGEYPKRQEVILWKRDGSSFIAEYQATPIIDNGKRKGAVVVFRDITGELEIYRAMESAERAGRAKSEFIAIMSHEIRTPMNGIIGMNSLLLETELTEEQRSYAQIIEQSADALLRILNDILDFSKMEAGKMTLGCELFDPRELIENVMELFRGRAVEKRLELGLELDEVLPQALYGDESKLRQVLVNLVSNAVKFTERGGVRVGVCLKDCPNGLDYLLEFYVRDTGIGIPEGKKGLLFQSFSQLHPAINRKYGGTGLGLAICRQLVQLMGGDIDASSPEGGGTEFRFRLPYRLIEGELMPYRDDEWASRRLIAGE